MQSIFLALMLAVTPAPDLINLNEKVDTQIRCVREDDSSVQISVQDPYRVRREGDFIIVEKYLGDEDLEVIYKLSPGETCVLSKPSALRMSATSVIVLPVISRQLEPARPISP